MSHVVIFGATSGIAQACARRFATEGNRLFLVARDPEKLRTVVRDIEIRSKEKVGFALADLNRIEDHDNLLEQAESFLGSIDIALITYGILGQQASCERVWRAAEAVINTNFLSTASLITRLANRMEERASGSLIVIGSVAGDRGRADNYVYGAAKAGLAVFLEGLRHRLAGSPVHILTVKPGRVATPMTAHMDQNWSFAKTEQIAKGILRGLKKGKSVIYLPWWWRWIMLIIRCMPRFLFNRFRS